MPKTRYTTRPRTRPRLQKLQREYRKQQGVYKSTYLAKVDGAVRLPGGLFWVHDANGTDANGNTIFGAPRKMPMLPGAAILPRPNTKVDVVTINGIDYIARSNSTELVRMGVDAHQTNSLDPGAQYKVLEWLTNLQGYKTPGASSTHIVGSVYKKPDGTYDVFPTTGGYDFVTANVPAADMQVVVCQWLDTDTNTITATVSSEVSRDTDLKHIDNVATTVSLINECVDAAPTSHIGVNAWRVYDDTTIGTLSDNNKLADLRGIVGTGGAGAGGGQVDEITAGTGISVDTAIPSAPVVALDINSLTETTTIDGTADFIPVYDASASGIRKVKPDNLPGGGAGGTTKTILTRTSTWVKTLGSDGTFDTANADDNGVSAPDWSSYDYLVVRMRLKSDANADNDGGILWINNDTTATNYRTSLLVSAAAAGVTGTQVNNNSVLYSGGAGVGGSPANTWADNEVVIFDINDTTRQKNMRNTVEGVRSTTQIALGLIGAWWQNTAAITRLAAEPVNGTNYVAGSYMEVIGVKEEAIGAASFATYNTTNVSSPPTATELSTNLGTPSTANRGKLWLLDDGGAGASVYLVANDGTNWWHFAGTKAL